jgi:hypothetical protein
MRIWTVLSGVMAPSFIVGGLGANALREGGLSAGRIAAGYLGLGSTVFFGAPFIGDAAQFFSTLAVPNFLLGGARTAYLREAGRSSVPRGVLRTSCLYLVPYALLTMIAGLEHMDARNRE